MVEQSRAKHSPASKLPISWEGDPSPQNDIKDTIESIAKRCRITERAMLAIFLPRGGIMLDDAFDEFEVSVNTFLADHPDMANQLTDDLLERSGGIRLPNTGKPREKNTGETKRTQTRGKRN